MSDIIEKYKSLRKWPYILEGIILLVVIASGGVFYYLDKELKIIKNDISSNNQILTQRIASLEADLATTTLTSQQMSQQLQNQNNDLQATISDITDTVGTLEKLSKTDKELLQKYSRVYFLSDNYVPMSLKNIDTKYLYDETKTMDFHTSALLYLKRMLDRAERDDISLKIVSAYRSFGTQSTLKNSYLTTYGSGANQFSADQGYSEHQLGTAVDLSEIDSSPILSIGFETSKAFEWLEKNAYKYGFVLSYPKNNVYYQYEPWHWRFVGVKLATRLHNDDISFSEMDQREIDTYLVKIFD